MKENTVIIITMIFNFFVAVTKISAGIIFSFSTLISDSIQSFIDFATDITSLIANKIGKRRANKTYPFGYGQVYYLANLFTGVLLFLIGMFIVCQFFFFDSELKPSRTLFVILGVALVMKLIVVTLLNHYGKKFKSEMIIEAAKESRADFISTCVVLGVLLLTVFDHYIPDSINIDKIGSFGMAIYVFYTSIKIIVNNIRGILTNDEDNEEIKEEIINELTKFDELEIDNIRIIKMAAYYGVFIKVRVKRNITIRKYLAIERKIKTCLKAKNKLIRFIDVEPV